MDPEIIGSIIGVGGTILGATISLVFNRKAKESDKRANEAVIKVEELEELFNSYKDASKKQYKSIAQKNSIFSLNEMKKEISFNKNGKGKLKSTWLGFNFHQTVTNVSIPYKYFFDDFEAKISKPQVKENKNSSEIVIYKPQKNWIDEDNDLIKTYKGSFIIRGRHNENEVFRGFTCIQEISNPFLNTKDEVIEKYGDEDWPYEFFSQDLEYPVSKLTLIVKFPYSINDFFKAPTPLVFLTGTTHINHKETDRINSGIEIDYQKNKVILHVDEPYPGNTYAISWVPPI